MNFSNILHNILAVPSSCQISSEPNISGVDFRMDFSNPHDRIDLSYLLNDQIHVKCMMLRENNYSYAAIARQLGISKSLVIKNLARYSTQTGTNCRSGNPPYGYVRANGILMRQPKEMEIILRILNLYKIQRTAYEIAVVLNHENISPRKAKQWDHSSVKKVLERYKNRLNEVEKFGSPPLMVGSGE